MREDSRKGVVLAHLAVSSQTARSYRSLPSQDSCVGPYVVDLAVCASACCFSARDPEMGAAKRRSKQTGSCNNFGVMKLAVSCRGHEPSWGSWSELLDHFILLPFRVVDPVVLWQMCSRGSE